MQLKIAPRKRRKKKKDVQEEATEWLPRNEYGVGKDDQ
jgi:hypothetical protein